METPSSLLRLLPLFPLLGAVLNGIFGRRIQARLGRGAVHGIAIGAMALSAAAAIAAVTALVRLPGERRYLLDRLWTLVDIAPLRVDLAFALDPLSAVLILVITVIGTLIHVYATGYMAEDPAPWRFFAYLNLFVFSMLLLVLGDSFLVLFFGWEGVGLCSYLLIGFWYGEEANARAGKKAFVTNRVGDWGFVVGMLLLFWGASGSWRGEAYVADAPVAQAAQLPAAAQAAAGRGDASARPASALPTLTFRTLEAELSRRDAGGELVVAAALRGKEIWGVPLLFLVGLALFVGVSGKSAQIPLYVWLPDAMAGPTPVSALIHAATMVTAGVYLIARLSFLFALEPAVMTLVAMTGVATAFLGALLALVQTDIKKVLAYSTISQLGFMILAAGVGAYWVAVFHLVTHACFKACLFLAAGSTIHAMHAVVPHAHESGGHDRRLAPDPSDPQDLRNMGGLAPHLPRTRLAYLLGCLAIAGFPIAAGFYSKDEILWRAFVARTTLVPGPVLYAVALCTAGMTAFYMFRSYYLAFEGRARDAEASAGLHESPRSMTIVLGILGAASVVVGAVLGWPEAWGGHPFLERFLHPVFASAETLDRRAPFGHPVAWALQGASVGVALLGWALARRLYRDLATTEATLTGLRARWRRTHRALTDKLYVDEVYGATIVRPAEGIARGFAFVDRRYVDGAVDALGRVGRIAAAIGGFLDRTLVDGVVNGVSALAISGGRRLARLQTGRINNYVLGITAGVVALVVVTWLAG